MTEIRELLRGAVTGPRRPFDVTALVEAARRRRRRRRLCAAVVALIAVVVAGGGVATLLAGGGSTSSVTIDASTPGHNPAAGVSVLLPSGWTDLARAVTNDPQEIMVVGTAARPTDDPITACQGQALPSASVYVSLYEYLPGQPLNLPGGQGTLGMAAFVPRGPDGSVTRLTGGSCAVPSPTPASGVPDSVSSVPTTTPNAGGDNHFDYIAFQDANRLFFARIVSTADPSGRLLQSGYDVLKTLHVDPPTAPSSTSPSSTPPVSGTSPAQAADARQSIIDALRAAFGGGGPVAHADGIEGGDPNQPTTQQSAAAASPNLVGTITPRVNWLVILDATHAQLNFDLLVNNQPVTANTTGLAIVENGHWKITRATYCEILHRGGTPCPG
jgi:hypothetical protein